MEKDDIEKAFDWMQIGCPEFDGILWYNTITREYKYKDKIVEESDPRLIAYKSKSKRLTPVDLFKF